MSEGSLTGRGPPEERVEAFLRWAAASRPDDGPAVRAQLAAARLDREVVRALADRTGAEQDHSRALIAIGALGEMRSPHAEVHLRRVVAEPLPPAEAGEGVRAGVEMRQARAVAGLAFLGAASADAEVLRAAGSHPSRAVRAEAIEAFLYNHPGDAAARARLEGAIRDADRVFLDRPRHEAGAPPEVFDRQLEAYLRAHPELVPPRPIKREGRP